MELFLYYKIFILYHFWFMKNNNSANIKKNGKKSSSQQNYFCKDCECQSIGGSCTDWSRL